MTTRLTSKISVTALCATLALLLVGCSMNAVSTVAPTLQPASATQPVIPTDTPISAQTSASTPTLEPQASAGNSGLTIQGLESSKSLMLDLINQARRDAGLDEVVLGDNPAAQMHAEDMRENCFSSQWGSDGTKPYMRYTLAGGTQYSLHATSGTEYCPPDPDRYKSKSLEEEIREVKLADDVLLPYLKKVNLGFAYSRPNLWVVQQFEGDYIEYDKLPEIDEEGKLSFSASVKNGAVVKDDALGVQIYYDPPPHELTRGQLARTYCYSTGKRQLASLREPLTDGSYYTEDEYTETDDICIDPYEIDPDSAPANSYEESSQLHNATQQASTGRTESYKVAWITAEQWATSESDFSVSADIKQLLLDNREGVYTILIWGEIDGEDIPISEYSIFISPDQMTSMNLNAISQPTNTPTTVPEPRQINSPTPQPTDTPIPAPTYPTDTSTPTPEASPTNTSTPTPVLIRNSGLTAEELEQANSLMLNLINQARIDAGLNQVILGDNTAAQMHTEDMRKNCFFAHWGSDGAKPYIRYTRAGGTQYEGENVSGTNYCPHDPHNYIQETLETKVREAMDGLMNSPGHRRNILNPHHKKVNLGFSYSMPNLWVVQQFEGDYIEFQEAPTIGNDGKLSFIASVKNGATFNTDGTGVRIYYDPPPHELTRGQLARTYCYSTGKQLVADLERPLSEYSYYVEGEFERTNGFCVNPYQISVDSAPANSYEDSSRLHDEAKSKSTGETEPYISKWLTAEVWNISENQLSISADLRTVLSENGEGVYTVVIWGEIYGEDVALSNYSVFVTSDQIASLTLDAPPHPPSATASGLSPRELEYAREYMLGLINQARRDAGLNEVVLGDNTAAQIHAEDELANCFSGHWGSDGTKPYMRYTLAGGTQYSRYIINGADYCPSDPHRYTYESLEEEIKELGYDGTVLLPYLKKVNLGFAYSKPNLWAVQQFEGDYIEYDKLPAIDEEGNLSFSASVKNDAVVKDDALGVQIYYDPPPHELRRGQLHRTYCYSTGKQQLASLRKPLTDGYHYTEDEYTETDGICVDPYEVDPDSSPASSYEEASQLHDEARQASTGYTEPYTVIWLTADQWVTSESDFSVSADIKQLLLENGDGVYTLLIWGEIDGEDVPISNYTIFVTRDQVASMSLDTPSQPTNTPTTVPEPQQINSPTPQPTNTPIPTATYTPVLTDTPIPTPTYTPTVASTPTYTSTPTPLPASPTFIKWMIADGVRPEEVQAAKDGAQAMYDLAIHLGLPQPTEDIRVYLDYDIQRLARSFVNETGVSLTDAIDTFENERVGGLASRTSNSAYVKTKPPSESISPSNLEWVAEATAHEITHVAYQRMLLGLDTNPAWFQKNRADSPDWLTEGMADLYSVIATDLISQIPYYLDRSELAVSSIELGFPLTAIEDVDLEDSEDGIWICQYDCGFIAVELLASHVGLTGLSNYYMMRRPASSWQYTFQTTFGMTVDEFYTLFEEHRTNGFPILELDETPGLKKDRPTSNTKLPWATNANIPHDVRIQVIDSSWMLHDYVVSLGMPDMRNKLNLYLYNTDDELARAIANEEGTSQQNAKEYLNDDYPVTSGQRWMTINASDEWFLETSIEYRMIFVGRELSRKYQALMASYNYYDSPYWINWGTAAFLSRQSLSEYGVLNYDSRRWEIVDDVQGEEKPLSGMVAWEGFNSLISEEPVSYSVLAVELLASHAGQSALIEYYKLLKLNSTWLEAFYKAFGMTVEEFYGLFSRHRADGFPKVDIPKFVTR